MNVLTTPKDLSPSPDDQTTGRDDDGVNALPQPTQPGPANVAALYSLNFCDMSLEQLDKSAEILRGTLSLTPNKNEALVSTVNLAVEYVKRGALSQGGLLLHYTKKLRPALADVQNFKDYAKHFIITGRNLADQDSTQARSLCNLALRISPAFARELLQSLLKANDPALSTVRARTSADAGSDSDPFATLDDTDRLVLSLRGGDATVHLPISDAPTVINFLTIEVSTHCNNKCAGCTRTVLTQQNAWQNKHMSVESFRRIVDNLPTVNLVTLHGIGEPTLNPDLPAIVQYAKASGKFGTIRTCTNGITRDADYIRALQRRGLDALAVSVDSFDQAIATKCRLGTKVDKLLENLRAYAGIGLPILISTVVGRNNAEDVPNLLEELNRIGRFEVRLQPLWDYGNPEACLSADQELAFSDLYKRNLHTLPNLRVETTLGFPPPPFCKDLWQAPAITVDGFLSPCTERRSPDDLGRFNLCERSYDEGWRSAYFQALLRRYANAAPVFCKGCPINSRAIEGD